VHQICVFNRAIDGLLQQQGRKEAITHLQYCQHIQKIVQTRSISASGVAAAAALKILFIRCIHESRIIQEWRQELQQNIYEWDPASPPHRWKKVTPCRRGPGWQIKLSSDINHQPEAAPQIRMEKHYFHGQQCGGVDRHLPSTRPQNYKMVWYAQQETLDTLAGTLNNTSRGNRAVKQHSDTHQCIAVVLKYSIVSQKKKQY
jgi:hypothetical protein